jgi:hypothetical protein
VAGQAGLGLVNRLQIVLNRGRRQHSVDFCNRKGDILTHQNT